MHSLGIEVRELTDGWAVVDGDTILKRGLPFDAARDEYLKRHGATRKVTICTDGSCWPNPGPGGWAFCVFQDGLETDVGQGSERHTTNNRMEITAVLEALRWLEANRPPLAVEILSDSQYVVNAVTKWRFGWRKRGWKKGRNKALPSADLWAEIDPLAERLSFELRWTRGHAGHAGNERADQLAEQARMSATAP